MTTVLRLWGVLLVVALLQGCGSMDSKVGGVLNLDTDLKLVINVDSDVNPDEKGHPSPVFLRMYELKSPTLMEQADFIALYERDTEVLGKDYIAKLELKRLAPGDARVEKHVLNAETQYIALFAEFFDYKNAKYKVVFPVTSNNIIRNSINIRLSGTDIIIEK